MSLYKFIVLSLFFISISCNIPETTTENKRHIDDIPFNPKIDSKEFELCYGEENLIQYFNVGNGLEYEGGKKEILKEVTKKYSSQKADKESGLIRIRFVINCKGETDRFRIIGMDNDYKEKVFSSSITNQLLRIVKKLDGWKPKVHNGNQRDYYQYLIFKIKDGEIIKILP